MVAPRAAIGPREEKRLFRRPAGSHPPFRQIAGERIEKANGAGAIGLGLVSLLPEDDAPLDEQSVVADVPPAQPERLGRTQAGVSDET